MEPVGSPIKTPDFEEFQLNLVVDDTFTAKGHHIVEPDEGKSIILVDYSQRNGGLIRHHSDRKKRDDRYHNLAKSVQIGFRLSDDHARVLRDLLNQQLGES